MKILRSALINQSLYSHVLIVAYAVKRLAGHLQVFLILSCKNLSIQIFNTSQNIFYLVKFWPLLLKYHTLFQYINEIFLWLYNPIWVDFKVIQMWGSTNRIAMNISVPFMCVEIKCKHEGASKMAQR